MQTLQILGLVLLCTVIIIVIAVFLRRKKPAPQELTEAQRVSRGLSQTSLFLQKTLDRLWGDSQGEKFYDNLEEALLTADVGLGLTEHLINELRREAGLRIPQKTELKANLARLMVGRLPSPTSLHTLLESSLPQKPRVIMITGVNGAGKTTTIAKLCHRFKEQNKKILVGAADTFRAAATEQLKQWVEKLEINGVFQKEGADPASVAFDAIQAAKNRDIDVCIIDTAGRLHTKQNLMDELGKMKRVMGKALEGAPHDIWLVVDGSTGQNALHQAREFHKILGLTGLIVTKLDGSAKGGALLATTAELQVPVVFIGVGESPEDLVPFNSTQYVDALLSGLQ